MTRVVDDYIDVALGVLMTAMMLFMGVWCWRYLTNLYSQPVIEKTAPTVQFNGRAPEHVYTGKDCLLELVINDAFCPDPNVIKFVAADTGASTTITYASNWFMNKEENINSRWTNFFKTYSKYEYVVFDLIYQSDGITPSYWLATMYKEVPTT